MKNLVLFPNRTFLMNSDNLEAFRERFPLETHVFFYVEDPAYQLEGVRFQDVYVHWYCYDEPGYNVYVAMILQARAFSENPGQTVLFS
jgi:hypothetical protein